MSKLKLAIANGQTDSTHARLRITLLRRPPLDAGIVCGLLMILAIGSVQISAAQDQPARNIPAPTPAGEMIIETIPSGLNVLIDGEPQGASPVKTILAEGQHTYSIQCSNKNISTRNFSIAAGKISTYKISCPTPLQPTPKGAVNLDQGQNNFAVDSTPTRLRVLIDGKVRGGSPVRTMLYRGAHKLLVECPGMNISQNFVIVTGVTRSYVLTCFDRPPGGHLGDIIIETEPSPLTVLIDGKPQGASPLHVTLNQSQHNFTIECPDTGHFTKTFSIPPGQSRTYTITCTLN